MAAPPPLSSGQLAQFERDGAIVADTPLSLAEVRTIDCMSPIENPSHAPLAHAVSLSCTAARVHADSTGVMANMCCHQVDAAEAAWDELSRMGKEYSARPDSEAGCKSS